MLFDKLTSLEGTAEAAVEFEGFFRHSSRNLTRCPQDKLAVLLKNGFMPRHTSSQGIFGNSTPIVFPILNAILLSRSIQALTLSNRA